MTNFLRSCILLDMKNTTSNAADALKTLELEWTRLLKLAIAAEGTVAAMNYRARMSEIDAQQRVVRRALRNEVK